jgi:hypothetical protein
MIKNGVSRLKKHNLRSRVKLGMTRCRRHAELVSASILFLLLLAGCKSAPAGRPVDPLELIDDQSSFYIAVPRQADNVLIERIITGFYKDASDSDAKMIADRVNKVYCGLNRSKHGTEVQTSIDGSIPQKYIPKVLSAKNGWVTSEYTPKDSASKYKIYSGPVEMTFPSAKIACAGRNLEGMLDKFDSLSALPADDSTELYSDLDKELTSYLKGAESEIRFYANKPQSFLTILTGAQLDLKLIDVKGSFTTDPKHPNQYLLDLDFNFKNGTFLKAGKTLLTLAFGLTNSQEEIVGDNKLIIHGIRIDKQQLYKLLSL